MGRSSRTEARGKCLCISVDADYDNGITLQGMPRCGGWDRSATSRLGMEKGVRECEAPVKSDLRYQARWIFVPLARVLWSATGAQAGPRCLGLYLDRVPLRDRANVHRRTLLLGGSANMGRKESARVQKPRRSPPYVMGSGFKKPPSSRPRASGNRSTGPLSVSGAGPL
jgi:hypothetical protein